MDEARTLQIDIQPELTKRLARYDNLSFAEQFAMFMGKAQLLELGLKGVLADKCGYDFDQMEKWTLGVVHRKLEEEAIHPDFLMLLKALVDERNFIAHEILAAEAIIGSLLGTSDKFTKNHRQLGKAIFMLEQIILHFDLNQEHDAWMPTEGEAEEGTR